MTLSIFMPRSKKEPARRDFDYLVKVLNNSTNTIEDRMNAVFYMGEIAEKEPAIRKDAVKILIPALEHSWHGMTNNASMALGSCGADAVPAVPKLVETLDRALEGKAPRVYTENLVEALVRIGSSSPDAANLVENRLNEMIGKHPAMNCKELVEEMSRAMAERGKK